MRADIVKLTHLMTAPSLSADLSSSEWRELIALAREENLLGKLGAILASHEQIPKGSPARHLVGALMLSRRQRQSVTWEAHKIDQALAELEVPVVLLKGAAYALGNFASADGRLFGDVDILVPREHIARVEMQLRMHGWNSLKLDAYDQRYYRQWMHEIPPMMHVHRGTVIDVHHTILPLTARYHPDPARIFSEASHLDGFRCLRIPSPEDLVIHSCCHLVHEGEVDNILRDIHDIARLLETRFSSHDTRMKLVHAAIHHDLQEPTSLALALVQQYFNRPEIAPMLDALEAHKWQSSHARLIKRYLRAIGPDLDSPPSWNKALARQLIYIRGHSLRMPLPMLLRHLARKAWMQWRDKEQTRTAEN